MRAPLLSSSNLEMLREHSDSKNAPLVVVPWSTFGTRRLYVNTPDGQLVGWVDLKTGHRSLAMPELASAFEIAVSEAADVPTAAVDSQMPRRALKQAIEFALIAGQASLQTRESAPEDRAQDRLEVSIAADNQADQQPALMRHAYRGKCAYSSWELGPCGKRLVAEELKELAALDPHWVYLNSLSFGDHDADIAQLFAGAAVV